MWPGDDSGEIRIELEGGDVLHIGLVGGAKVTFVVRRLLELGAIPATGQEGSWAAVDEPKVLVHDLSRNPTGAQPCIHLVVEVAEPPGEPFARAAARTESLGAPGNGADVRLDGSTSTNQLLADVDQLWLQRIAPFEANLRASKRAPRNRRPLLTASDPMWPLAADRLIGRLQQTLGPLVDRIDHIGSTSVPGLPSKDLVDIQVTVAELEGARKAAAAARRAGFVHASGEWFGRDRSGVEHPEDVAVDADPGRPANVNFRPVTAPVWRETLLFRDWLRSHPDERDAYAAMKRDLAGRPSIDVDDYSTKKAPWIDGALDRAEEWAKGVRWAPQP